MEKCEIFLDSANLESIEEWSWLIGGVTTNQKIFAKEGIHDIDSLFERVKEIVVLTPVGHISVQLPLGYTEESHSTDMEWIRELFEISPHKVVLKLPPFKGSLPIIEELKSPYLNPYKTFNPQINITAVTRRSQLFFLRHELIDQYDFVSIFYNRAPKKKFYDLDIKTEVHDVEWSEEWAMVGKPDMNVIFGSIRKPEDITDILRQAWYISNVILTVPPKVLEAIYYSDEVMSILEEFDGAFRSK